MILSLYCILERDWPLLFIHLPILVQIEMTFPALMYELRNRQFGLLLLLLLSIILKYVYLLKKQPKTYLQILNIICMGSQSPPLSAEWKLACGGNICKSIDCLREGLATWILYILYSTKFIKVILHYKSIHNQAQIHTHTHIYVYNYQHVW